MSRTPLPTRPSSVMRLDSVRFGYHDGEDVLAGVTADVAPGRLHVVIGPNAAGKSTLLKLMLGHLRPTSGRISFDGEAVHRLGHRSRAKRIAYVPQRSTVGFAFTVQQVVAMARYSLPEDPVAIDTAMEALQLRQLAQRPYPELSVGQQQRVILARAMAQLAGQGRMLLLDEPTSAMDLAHVHQVMGRVKRIAAEGVAVVAVLHDLNLAARYADDVWLLHQGIVARSGPWPQVLTPEVLEPVYGVKLNMLEPDATRFGGEPARPVFDVRLPDSAARP